jgi:hypothetical protein
VAIKEFSMRAALNVFAGWLLVVLMGCSSGESKGTIGASLLTLENPFFQVIGENITAEAAKHGYKATILSADESVVGRKTGRSSQRFHRQWRFGDRAQPLRTRRHWTHHQRS